MFSIPLKTNSNSSAKFNMSANAFEKDQSKNLSFGRVKIPLTFYQTTKFCNTYPN